MYPSQDQDYPSPAPSDTHSSQQPDQHQNQSSFGQIDSSIGPSRVSRRQASLKCLPVRRVSLSLNYARPEDAQSQDATGPHPDSPSTLVASPHVPSVQSPYHPNTPSSMASSYSSFEHVRRSRTRSTSHFEGRSHSPALSTTSGVTHSSYTFDNSTSADQSNLPARAIVREKHKKHRLRDVDRKSICIYHLTHPNARQEDIGAHFGVERSTISKILKEKDRWLSISVEDECDQSAKHRPSKFPEIEETMLNSLQEWSDRGDVITDQLIRERALSIAKSFHIPSDKFKGSSGWVENFKNRHDIRRGEWLQANKMLPPDYAIHQSHSSTGTVPPTPVLMEYDQRVHAHESESQSSNKPSGSHEDQDHQHVHGRLLATTTHWPETMRNDVPHSPLTSSSTIVDPILRAQGSSLESDHPLSGHSLQDIQHSPEIQHHQPQPLYHHNQHHIHQKHHNHQQHHHHHHSQQQHQAVVYNAYGLGHTPALCGPGVSAPPTIAEAEQAINLLITFIDNDDRGIIKEDERQKLDDIKSALFQAANGIPYERSAD